MATAIRPTTSLLHVEEMKVNEEGRVEVEELARRWMLLSDRQLEQCPEDDEKKRELYERSRRVNSVVLQRSLWIKEFTKRFSILFCYGLDLETKGFALIKPLKVKPLGNKEFLHLNFLSTDPNNLLNPIPITKVGTTLLEFLYQKCRNEGYEGIYVQPLRGAIPFFEKKLFIHQPEIPDKYTLIWRP